MNFIKSVWLKETHQKYPGIDLLMFNSDLEDKTQKLEKLRESYIKQVDLPIWKRKLYVKKITILILLPSYISIFLYRKLERLLDYFEYGI